MLGRLVDWWYGASATTAASAQSLAAPAAAHPKQHHPAPSSSSSSGIVAALENEVLNVATSRPMASGDGSDELGVFQQSIIDEIATLTANLAVWRNRKIELLGGEENIGQTPAVLGGEHVSGFSDFMQLVKEDLVSLVTTPAEEMKALMDRIRPYLDTQQQRVNALVSQLHISTDEQEQRRIKVQICDINITLLQTFIQIINDIKVKIESSLALEVFSEKVALNLLSTMLLVMAQFVFPQVDAQVEQGLRDYMGRSIRSEGSDLNDLLTRFEGLLSQGWRHVGADRTHVDSAASAAADAATLPVDTVGTVPPVQAEATPSASGLFAAAAADVNAALRQSPNAETSAVHAFK